MAYLVVAGVTVPVALESVREVAVPVGQVRRAFSGAPRSSVSSYKREWRGIATKWMTRATANTLRAALDNTPPLTVTGDLTGSISAYIQNIEDAGRTKLAGGEYVRLSFDMLEA